MQRRFNLTKHVGRQRARQIGAQYAVILVLVAKSRRLLIERHVAPRMKSSAQKTWRERLCAALVYLCFTFLARFDLVPSDLIKLISLRMAATVLCGDLVVTSIVRRFEWRGASTISSADFLRADSGLVSLRRSRRSGLTMRRHNSSTSQTRRMGTNRLPRALASFLTSANATKSAGLFCRSSDVKMKL